MSLPSHDDPHLLAGAYALDALDDVERARFERHLTGCPTCQDDVAGFTSATGLLAEAVASPPPARLRTDVLALVSQTRQVSALTPAARGRRRRVALLGVAAAVIIAFGALSVGLTQAARSNRQENAIAAVTQAGDAQMARLTGATGAIHVTYSTAQQASVLVADDLPAIPAGRVYELWLIQDNKPTRSITFTPNSKNRATVRFNGTPAPGTVYAITEEPDGGSDAPTTTPTHVSEPV